MKPLRSLLMAFCATACSGQTPFTPNYTPAAVFSTPTAITNPYLPLSSLTQDILEGTEGGKPFRVVRSHTTGTRMFTFNGVQVSTVIVIDSAFLNDTLIEVAIDYFAQSDHGDVYYFGEDVDNYQNGQVANHDGSWLFGVQTTTVGLFIPAAPKVGDRFRSEDVPGITREDDEVVAVNETVVTAAGTYQNCVRVKEILSDGAVEYKLYAPGIGIVKEITEDGESGLKSHS